jgi:DNA-binding transcriptional LysR family regulator
LITLARGTGLRAVLDNACREAGFTPRITAEASELGSLVELAAEGPRVALLHRSALDAAEPRLAIIDTLDTRRPCATGSRSVRPALLWG